jgi:hypothetical protein
MKKLELKALVREAVSARLTKLTASKFIKEGVMSDIDIIAQESATFQEFISSITADPAYKSLDANDPEVKSFLQQMYDDAQHMSETKHPLRR